MTFDGIQTALWDLSGQEEVQKFENKFLNYFILIFIISKINM